MELQAEAAAETKEESDTPLVQRWAELKGMTVQKLEQETGLTAEQMGAEHHRRQQDSHNWTCESTEPHENAHDQQRPETKRDSDGETAAVTASRTKPEEEKE